MEHLKSFVAKLAALPLPKNNRDVNAVFVTLNDRTSRTIHRNNRLEIVDKDGETAGWDYTLQIEEGFLGRYNDLEKRWGDIVLLELCVHCDFVESFKM